MRRRWALVVMGAWLMGSIAMSVVATENFYTIDRLLDSSPSAVFGSTVRTLGRPASRELLRYLSSELNRLYFQMWNGAQLVLGGVALWLVVASAARVPRDAAARRRARLAEPAALGIVAMLAIVVLMLGYLTPAIVSLGRELDFVPREPAPPGMSRFWVLHAAYTSLEMIKLVVGGVVAFWIVRSSS
jgi:hypothetical protein